MSNLSESTIERASIKKAKSEGWWGIKLVPQFVKGLPDRMFIGHGKAVFVEFKTDKGKLSKMQIYIHKKFLDHGIAVYVSRSVEETMEILDANKK